MDKDRLIELIEVTQLILMYGGVVALFPGILFSLIFAIGGLISIFISILFAYWKIKLEEKRDREYFKMIAFCEDIETAPATIRAACTDKEGIK